MTIRDIDVRFADSRFGPLITSKSWSGYIGDIIPGTDLVNVEKAKLITLDNGHITVIVAFLFDEWKISLVADDRMNSGIWQRARARFNSEVWEARFKTLGDLIDYIMIENL